MRHARRRNFHKVESEESQYETAIPATCEYESIIGDNAPGDYDNIGNGVLTPNTKIRVQAKQQEYEATSDSEQSALTFSKTKSPSFWWDASHHQIN